MFSTTDVNLQRAAEQLIAGSRSMPHYLRLFSRAPLASRLNARRLQHQIKALRSITTLYTFPTVR
jgi:hypothetical protein